MGGFGSGGANKKTIAEHIADGTLRPGRHLTVAPPPPSVPVSKTDRATCLAGLGPAARKLVAKILDEFTGWDPASLHTLHQYGLSCQRLAELEAAGDDNGRRDETRLNLALLRSLKLESSR